jgi:hypothetical protein
MAIKLLNQNDKRSSPSDPKAQGPQTRKPARLREFSAPKGGNPFPPHFPPRPGAFWGEQGPFPCPSGKAQRPARRSLGEPLSIDQVAELLGCSPWTVRNALIPRGIPHFRFSASGRLTFFEDQVIRWIENQQEGGQTTK